MKLAKSSSPDEIIIEVEVEKYLSCGKQHGTGLILARDNSEFYSSLSQSCGALQIACLHPSSLLESCLNRHLQNWLHGPNAGLLPWLDQRAGLLSRPFSNRPRMKSLLLFSFLPVPDSGSPLLELPVARAGRPAGRLAAYVFNTDYHVTGEQILCRAAALLELSEGTFEKGVDAGPLMEKSLAAAAGLGLYGFNTLLRTRDWGTTAHLGYLFSEKSLPEQVYHPEINPPCDDCRRCLLHCPNRALSAAAGLQLHLCRSWLAGEKKGPLSWAEQKLLGGALAGCSLCSSCCPGCRLTSGGREIDAESLFRMPSAQLARLLTGTVLEHIGTARLKRNAVAALGTQLNLDVRRTLQPELLQCSNSENIRRTLAAWPPDD